MARLPQPGSDSGKWGEILNEYLSQSHKSDGTLKDNAVASSVLAPNSVTSASIANDAVTATQIADGTIQEAQLASAVTTKLNAPADITDGSVTKDKLEDAIKASLSKADTSAQLPVSRTTDIALMKNESAQTPQQFGAKGDGLSDDTAALQAWLASGATDSYLPPGIYLTTTGLVQPQTMSVECAKGARIKASATFTGALWQIATVSTAARRKRLTGGVFDCDGKAEYGILMMAFEHFELSDVEVYNPTMHGIIVGDPSTAGVPFEAIVQNICVMRPASVTPPVGSYGLWIRRATDGEYSVANIIGFDTGVRVDTFSNRFIQMHPWGYSGKLPSVAFEDRGERNIWIGCEADTPTTYGWWLKGKYTNIIGGRVFNNSLGADNVLVGVSSAQTDPTFTAIGLHFQGADGSHRIASDYAGFGGYGSSVIIGSRCDYVATQNVAQVTMPTMRVSSAMNISSSNTDALAVRDLANAVTFHVNPVSKIASVLNGGELRGYIGNFSTITLRLLASSGGIRPGTTSGSGSTIFSGNGAPSIAGTVGDIYIRADGGDGTWIYRCTATGAVGAATWAAKL